MNTTINHTNPTNFKARLYNTKGQRIRCTDFFEQFGKDVMATKGSPQTDIFVKSIKSEPTAIDLRDFKITADLVIKNPLLGSKAFTEVIDDRYAHACETDIDELHFLDKLTGLRTNDCENLENKALYIQIIDRIKSDIDKKNLKLEDSRPTEVLETMLKEVPAEAHGFTKERIDGFRKIANRMEDSLKNDKDFRGYEWLI